MKFNVCISREGGCPDTGLCPGCTRQGITGVPDDYTFWLSIDAPYTGVQTAIFTVNLLGGVYPGINAGAGGGWTADGGIYMGFDITNVVFRPTNQNFGPSIDPTGFKLVKDFNFFDATIKEGVIMGENSDGVFVSSCNSNELILQS
jgi:hypothetical protein